MTNYIETYVGPGISTLYISDDIKEKSYIKDKQSRYGYWSGGCGIGSASSLEMARTRLHSYAINDLLDKRANLRQCLDIVAKSIKEIRNFDNEIFLKNFKCKKDLS